MTSVIVTKFLLEYSKLDSMSSDAIDLHSKCRDINKQLMRDPSNSKLIEDYKTYAQKFLEVQNSISKQNTICLDLLKQLSKECKPGELSELSNVFAEYGLPIIVDIEGDLFGVSLN